MPLTLIERVGPNSVTPEKIDQYITKNYFGRNKVDSEFSKRRISEQEVVLLANDMNTQFPKIFGWNNF